MFVAISLEELRREQEAASSNPGAPARSSTPAYERGLRDDCTRIVEKFVKLQNARAVRPVFY